MQTQGKNTDAEFEAFHEEALWDTLQKGRIHWNKHRNLRSLHVFDDVYRRCTSRLRNSNALISTSFRNKVMDALPEFYEACVEVRCWFNLYYFLSDEIFIDTSNLNYLLRQRNDDEYLAWIGVSIATSYIALSGMNESNIRLCLETLWPGVILDHDYDITVEHVINMLYGPSTWQLLGPPTSVGSYEQFTTAMDIIHDGLPLVIGKENTVLDISLDIPENIIV